MQQDAEGRDGLSILMIDDDDGVRDSLGLLLTRLGHRVVAVASGEEGLREVEQGIEADLVLLDLNMPGLGGVGTLRGIRALRPELEVLIVTGLDRRADDAIAGDPNASLLQKPFSMAELRRLLEAAKARARSAVRRETTR